VPAGSVQARMSLDSVLARQAGVISRQQALACGLSRAAIDHRLRLRRWRPLHPKVYLAAGHRRDDEVKVRAALLWAGDGAALSGVAAAWWEGMVEQAPARVGVTVARSRCPRSRPGVSVRRRTLADEDLVVHRGLAVTARPLTVLEAAVELGAPGSLLLDRALQRWVRFPAVYEAYCRNLGAHGSASAGRMLVAAADRSASVAERLLVRMLRESGAAGWHCAYPALGYAIDIAFPAAKIAIEVDGWAWHMDAERAAADKRRQNALVRAGWTILRYTWHDLDGRPKSVLAEIASEVGARSLAGRAS
jgi:very-short-patch-repair endonuclease